MKGKDKLNNINNNFKKYKEKCHMIITMDKI